MHVGRSSVGTDLPRSGMTRTRAGGHSRLWNLPSSCSLNDQVKTLCKRNVHCLFNRLARRTFWCCSFQSIHLQLATNYHKGRTHANITFWPPKKGQSTDSPFKVLGYLCDLLISSLQSHLRCPAMPSTAIAGNRYAALLSDSGSEDAAEPRTAKKVKAKRKAKRKAPVEAGQDA